MPNKLNFAHLPTPLWHSARLDELLGTQVWVKRDDATAGAESGNKIRKLEFLLCEAIARKSRWVVTCGGWQSNHARTTALLCARLGLRTQLFLRSEDPNPAVTGNLLLDRMAGAEVRFITRAQYQDRDQLMNQAQADLERSGQPCYVIPEGGSNGLGALGYVEAMHEVRVQLDLGLGGGPAPFDAVVHACGSGGTAAGVALGAWRWGVAEQCLAIAVCDDKSYFAPLIERIISESKALDPELTQSAGLEIIDQYKGPAYGVASPEQKRFLIDVTRRTGMVLDPVYSGKALYGLAQMTEKPARILFIHTGGLPGLLAQATELEEVL
jgi:D-cysteine desulfhydrase